ncbi:hypothetical protein like AT2G15960 [Hibiscus trionum]|uniref:Uncharacterized protein n=1 Tax=Hibiscus trionum TaxID=183268 RepID=A0A9W7MPA7_HIBTR|nr:hypothetical protein like AT2G15960 [Hibiscus trionum]
MSAIVVVWVDEIEKLKEKVQARRPLLWRAKKEQRSAQETRVEEKEAARETTLSETTLCLLMDRFVPW